MIMKKSGLLYLILYVVVFACPSCKKETDTFGPQISISKPYENQQFGVYDEISVVANICDDRKLASIDISIVDEEFITMMTTQTIYPENNCYDANISIRINDISIPTGDYYVLIRASDGVNETKKFQKIYITTLPKKLKYLIVVSKNAGQVNISKIDSTNTLILLKTLTTDYCGSAVSSTAQQFYIAGRYKGDVEVYSTIDWQLQWSIPCIISPPFPYFEAIDVHKKMLYVSYRGGKFEIYNEYGSIRAQKAIDNGNYALLFRPVGNYLVTYERSVSEMSKNLVVYYTPSYTVRLKYNLNYEISNIQSLSETEGLLFCNHLTNSPIKVVDIDGQTITDIATYNAYPINSVVHVFQKEYAFIAANSIFYYSYPDLNPFGFYNAANISHLAYDEINNFCYFSEDFHQVKKFSFPFANLQTIATMPDTIINILPVFNKD